MSEWIKWEGGYCPVPVNTLVDVKLRSGEIEHKQLAWGINETSLINGDSDSYAGHSFWRKDNSAADIIAYRIHKEES